jgi:hypothetical protein
VPDAERARHAGADEWDDLLEHRRYLGVHGVSRKRRVAIQRRRLAKPHNWLLLLFVRRQDSQIVAAGFIGSGVQIAAGGRDRRMPQGVAEDPLGQLLLLRRSADRGAGIERQVPHPGGERQQRLEGLEPPASAGRRPDEAVRVALQIG